MINYVVSYINTFANFSIKVLVLINYKGDIKSTLE